MRRTLRLLADIKPAAARYLEAGQPTGLAGLTTHGSPRSTLMYLYSRTLERLQELPESSVYRRSAEATTRHRLSIVEAAVPPGHAEWHERALEIMREHPDKFKEADVNGVLTKIGDATFLDRQEKPEFDQRLLEWDGEIDEGANTEGLRSAEDKAADHEALLSREPISEEKIFWEPEPQLTAEQIEEVENKIGAGLIEEVVRTAENELKLIGIMKNAKVWEPLEEKPAEGQWTYFERNEA